MHGFSKKAESHSHAVSIGVISYNLCTPHWTPTERAKGQPTTPAMAVGRERRVSTMRAGADRMDDHCAILTA